MSHYTDPKSWGPHFWYMMRCVAYNYPQYPNSADKAHAKDFYNSLKHTLPCKNCSLNYRTLLQKYPVDRYYQNRNKLMDWVEMIYQQTEHDKAYDSHSCQGAPNNRACPNCHRSH